LLTAYSSCYSRQYQITGNEMEWNTQDKTSVEKKWNGIHKKNFNSYTSVYRSNFIFSLFRAEENYRFVCAFSTVLTMHDNSVQNQFYRLISAFTQVLIKFRSQESCQSYKQTIGIHGNSWMSVQNWSHKKTGPIQSTNHFISITNHIMLLNEVSNTPEQ
jgi:hypothetical protein